MQSLLYGASIKSWLNQESELVLPITGDQPSVRDRLTLGRRISATSREEEENPVLRRTN